MQLLRYCFPTFFRAREWAGAHFTAGGQAAVLAALASVPVVIYSESPLFHLFAAFTSLLLVAGVAGFLFQPRLTASAAAVPAVHQGDEVRLDLVLHNGALTPAFDLEVSLHGVAGGPWRVPSLARYVSQIMPRQALSVALPLVPGKRGVFPWPLLNVTTSFPLNMVIRRQQYRVPGELVVYPQYAQLAVAALLEGRDAGELSEWEHVAQSGGSTVYSGNREYVPGMFVRRWDYSSWARTGKPIVREITDPPQSSLCLIVDTSLPTGSGVSSDKAAAALEMALSLAAGLADRLLREEWSIHTCIVGPIKIVAGSGSESLSLEEILTALARAEGTSDKNFLTLRQHVSQELDTENVAWLVLPAWHAQAQELCQALADDQVNWQAAVVGPVPDSLPAEIATSLRSVSLTQGEQEELS